MRGFRIVARPLGSPPVSCRYQSPLEMRRGCRHAFPGEEGNQPSSPLEAGKRCFLEFRRETQCSSRVGMGISGNFWSIVKHVEGSIEFQGKRGLSFETLQRKRASSSRLERIS